MRKCTPPPVAAKSDAQTKPRIRKSKNTSTEGGEEEKECIKLAAAESGAETSALRGGGSERTTCT